MSRELSVPIARGHAGELKRTRSHVLVALCDQRDHGHVVGNPRLLALQLLNTGTSINPAEQ